MDAVHATPTWDPPVRMLAGAASEVRRLAQMVATLDAARDDDERRRMLGYLVERYGRPSAPPPERAPRRG
jgi:hypothetical protein